VPLTLPSHTSMMTGELPPAHGVRINGAIRSDGPPTLAAQLKAAGYQTRAVVGAFVLDRRFGLDNGFDVYDDRIARDPGAMDTLQAYSNARNFGLTITPARTNEDAFRIFRERDVQAVFLDEISLAQGVAKSPLADPAGVMMSDGAVGAEPFSLIFVKGDAPFRNLVLNTMRRLYTSGEIRTIYTKWFLNAIPPEGISLNLQVSEPLNNVFRQPTDSPDPALYQ
jgi:glutamate/aspartate transport system substrate-binding protein